MNHKNKPVALVLGGTVPHCELIRQLQQRGYFTILIDYLDNPPAKAAADLHVKESALDKEKVLSIAMAMKASLVISGCVDQANISACYALEQMGLYAPYSYEMASKITNKGYMKRVMLENNIPSSPYVYIDSEEQISGINIPYPVMVKPADSNSANGVKKVTNKTQMNTYLKQALKISRNGRAIVEGFVGGEEISAYCYVLNHKAKLLMTAQRLSITEGEDKVIKCYASIAPANISKTVEQRAEEIATRIAEALGLDNIPLFFQGKVIGDDIFVIEFAPRVGGGISFKTIYQNTGFDIIAATIDSYLGADPDLSTWHEPSHIVSVNTIYGEDGVYDHMEGSKALLENHLIEDMFYHKTKGMQLDNSRASSSRVGAFIVKAKTEAEMLSRVDEAYRQLDVLDDQGRSLIRRDLSLYALAEQIGLRRCNHKLSG